MICSHSTFCNHDSQSFISPHCTHRYICVCHCEHALFLCVHLHGCVNECWAAAVFVPCNPEQPVESVLQTEGGFMAGHMALLWLIQKPHSLACSHMLNRAVADLTLLGIQSVNTAKTEQTHTVGHIFCKAFKRTMNSLVCPMLQSSRTSSPLHLTSPWGAWDTPTKMPKIVDVAAGSEASFQRQLPTATTRWRKLKALF